MFFRVVEDAADYLANTPGEKLVISYWHKEVGDVLEKGMARFAPVRVDGSVAGPERTVRVARFQRDRACRVFLAQIAACGEAIDAMQRYSISQLPVVRDGELGSLADVIGSLQDRDLLDRVFKNADALHENVATAMQPPLAAVEGT